MEAAMNSMRFEQEKTIKIRVVDVLSSVNQQTLGLREEINDTIEEAKLGLRTSFRTRTLSFRGG
jgi:hypothetical protein